MADPINTRTAPSGMRLAHYDKPYWSYCIDARPDTDGYGGHGHPWTPEEPWGRVPSVTTINGVLAKDFLAPWAHNTACEAAWLVSTDASSATVTEPIYAGIRKDAFAKIGRAKKMRDREKASEVKAEAVAELRRADKIKADGYFMPDHWRQFSRDMTHAGLSHTAKRDDAALRGSEIHLINEEWVKFGRFPDFKKFTASRLGYARAMAKFIAKYGDQMTVAEQIVGSVKHGFAGTCDTVIRLRLGDHAVRADFKTSKQVYARSHFRQLGAYEGGAVECGEDPTDRLAVVIIGADGEFTIHYSDEVEWRTTPFGSFLRVLDVWRDEQPLKAHEDATYKARRAREKAAKA